MSIETAATSCASRCGPSTDQVRRSSSLRASHSPLRVPMASRSVMAPLRRSTDRREGDRRTGGRQDRDLPARPATGASRRGRPSGAPELSGGWRRLPGSRGFTVSPGSRCEVPVGRRGRARSSPPWRAVRRRRPAPRRPGRHARGPPARPAPSAPGPRRAPGARGRPAPRRAPAPARPARRGPAASCRCSRACSRLRTCATRDRLDRASASTTSSDDGDDDDEHDDPGIHGSPSSRPRVLDSRRGGVPGGLAGKRPVAANREAQNQHGSGPLGSAVGHFSALPACHWSHGMAQS